MNTKYAQYMVSSQVEDTLVWPSHSVPDLEENLTAATLKVNSPVNHHTLSFHHNGTVVGVLDWNDGIMKFSGNVDESARKLEDSMMNYTHQARAEVTQLRDMLAKTLTVLNQEQFEDPRIKKVLDYLHGVEFFESKIRGE
jgi:hypothetical protein